MASSVEVNDNLKQQFQLLQDQQQKKLQRRKQKKEEKEKTQVAETAASTAFGIDDNLDLKLADPPPKTSSIYTEELVDHLNEQIRELKDETGRLYKLLSERDLENRQLRKKQDEQKLALQGSGNLASENAATKIVELSRKVREMTADLESERTKNRQLVKKCKDLENEVFMSSKAGAIEKGSSAGKSSADRTKAWASDEDPRAALEEELKTARDKLKQLESKVTEYRNQNTTLKNELKMAHKVVANEVGDGVSVQSLLNNNSGWKGRSQQIIALQKKVSELKSQLGLQSSKGTRTQRETAGEDDLDLDLEAEFMGTWATGSNTYRKKTADERHKETIRKLDKERKESAEKAAAEYKAMEADHKSMKEKLEASKARNKVLSNELKSIKQQTQVLLDKGKHDDELIDALLKQQNKLKQTIEDANKLQQMSEQKKEEKLKELSMKTQQDNNVVEQLKSIVAEKEAQVHALESEIQQMRMMNLHKAQMEGVSAIFDDHPSRMSMNSSRPPTAQVLEENSFTPVPSARGSERGVSRQSAISTINGDLTDRPSSKKGVRPNSGANRQEVMELQMQCQEFHSLLQAAEVERDKMTELVQVLQKRLDESTQTITDAQGELQSQRRRNVQLEKQLGKSKVEQTQAKPASSVKRSKTKMTASATSARESIAFDEDVSKADMLPTEANMEELQTSLAIQKDENEALKAALQRTLQAKEEDLRLYQEIMDETKKAFLQSLRQYRQNAGQ